MKRITLITNSLFLILLLQVKLYSQSTSPAPYCNGGYATGQCNQPGPSNSPTNGINDFIDIFSTTGGNTNINNSGSGCNGGPNNYMNYCSHYLAVTPGQTISCLLQSGITFAQGFAIWVDWDQDATFNLTNEFVAASPNVPNAATPITLTFVIPPGQPNGIYRLRVRCAFATNGPNITPCGQFGFGETEDYTLFVGPVPPNSSVPTGTALVNTPVCVGQALNFSLSTTYSSPLSYTWTGPNSFSSTSQNPTLFNSQTAASGIYTVLVTNSICPVTRTVAALVVAYPAYTVVPNYTICQGASTVVTVLSGMSPLLNTVNWGSTSPGGGMILPPFSTTASANFNATILPDLLPAGVSSALATYTVKMSANVHPVCSITQTVGITINNPLTPTLTLPAPICDNNLPIQLTANPTGGTWSSITPSLVTISGQMSPTFAAIGTNTVSYLISIGNCTATNSGTFSVDQFISSALTTTLAMKCVQDPNFNLMNIVQNVSTGTWTAAQPYQNAVNSNNILNVTGAPPGMSNLVLTYSTNSQPIGGVCTSSTVLNVSVFNPPTPVTHSINPACNNSPTIALTANPPGGVWVGQGVSTSGIRTASLCAIGNNTVMYTAGIGTCVASTFTNYHISKYNTAAFSNIIPPLCANSGTINLMSIVQNTNGSWEQYMPAPTNNWVALSNNSFNTQNFIPGTTYFQLRYNTHSTPILSPPINVCDESNSMTLSVLYAPTPSITTVGPLCSVGNTIQLSANPSTGHWVPTSYLTSTGIFDPTQAAHGNNQVQYVVGTNTCNAFQTSIINIEAFVPAALTGGVPDQCNTNLPVSLSPIAANGTGIWSGHGVVGASFVPSNTGAGTFILTYQTASSPSGLCPDQSTVAVNVYSLASPSIKNEGPFCNNTLPIQLQVSPVGGLFDGPVVGAVSSGGVFNPALGVVGENLITYTISSGPCLAYAQTRISIEEFVSADLGKDVQMAYCQNLPPFNLNSLVQNPGGTWIGGAGLTGSMFDPAQANIGDNNILVYQTHSYPNALLCPDSHTIQLNVKPVPKVTAVSSVNEPGCAPLNVTFNTPNVNKGLASWNITDGSDVQEGYVINHTFNNPGTYTVVFSYKDDEATGNGCVAQYILPNPIVVMEAPKADFAVSPEEITISDPEVTLTNLSTVFENNNYTWTIQGVKDVYEINPRVKFPLPGNYKITLLATSLQGCKDEVSKVIEVKNNFSIHIPNSFTPNFDNLNDTFIPVFSQYGLDSKTFEMDIFDRWGHQVYGTKDVTKGWNGMIRDEIAKEGTYIYKIRYRDLDGKVYNKTGYLSLLRN